MHPGLAQIALLSGRTFSKNLTHYVQQIIHLTALKLCTNQKDSYPSITFAGFSYLQMQDVLLRSSFA